MKTSLVVTVLNEEKSIEKLLASIETQTKKPDETIIVDGGSTDKTQELIKNYSLRIKNLKVIVKKGNRAIGRNEGIKSAAGDVILVTDAGCILDKAWVQYIAKPFTDKTIDVVSGYYKGIARNVFQKCLIPYLLVMPDKIDPDNFLPATRSMAFTRAIWKKVDGFDENFSHNEDFVFANKLKKVGAIIVFEKDAIVNWIPRNTYKEAFVMFSRFSFGDAEAGILRTKVLLLFARYFLTFYFIFLSLLYRSLIPVIVIIMAFALYVIWSIKKNYKYVDDKRAIIILPMLQIVADVAVLTGTYIGLIKRIGKIDYYLYLRQNRFLFFIIFIYSGILLFTLRWGIPNQYHPFPYHMDEWHQLQAVANSFRYGTPNTAGSANGTMFHFLLSGSYLIPFMLLKIINPFALQIENYFMRERIFEILRLQTIIFGVLSIFVLYKIAELMNMNKKIAIFLFTFTPIWLMLSGYFKYDIALIFWILLSLYFLFRFTKDPSNKNYLLAAIPGGLVVAVKISALPLFIIYLVSYFWFTKKMKKNLKYLFLGVGLFISWVIMFGMPDSLFGKGNILGYLYDNTVIASKEILNLNLNTNSIFYLFFYHYPMMFGYGFMFLFVISLFIIFYQIVKNGFKNVFREQKIELFLLFCLVIFILSLLSIKLASAGNRTLILLPFFTLIITSVFKSSLYRGKKKIIILLILSIVFIAQIWQSIAWMSLKVTKSPQEVSSMWIIKNIPKNSTIGIENIPIYQYLPNTIQKEYYYYQYKINVKNKYLYRIINSKSSAYPEFVIITNGSIEEKLLKVSEKRNLMLRIKQKGYRKIAEFSPDLQYYNFFGTEKDYYIAGIVTMPLTITLYRR